MSISPEIFYLHIQGEQRGPYTVQHIDHLLNSGLINEDALFWREGLEQWQPVTLLVRLRKRRKSWRFPVSLVLAAVIFGVAASIFGPITRDGWREIYQHDFTAQAAYWRARDVVRHQGVPKGALVVFDDFSKAQVTLSQRQSEVLVRGQLSLGGAPAQPTLWRVRLRFDPALREWSGIGVAQEAEVLK